MTALPIMLALGVLALIASGGKKKASTSPASADACYQKLADWLIAHPTGLASFATSVSKRKPDAVLLAGGAGQALGACLSNGFPETVPVDVDINALLTERLQKCRNVVVVTFRDLIEAQGLGQDLETFLRANGANVEADCVKALRTGAAA